MHRTDRETFVPTVLREIPVNRYTASEAKMSPDAVGGGAPLSKQGQISAREKRIG